MLLPLFSSSCVHVGWLEPGRFVFDTETRFVAFIANGHAWSAISAAWIGPAVGHHLFDTDGRPVAWSPGSRLSAMGAPLRPVNVVRPVTPVRPVRPVSPIRPLEAPMVAWSAFTFAEWLVRFDRVPEPEPTVDEVSSEPNPADAIPPPKTSGGDTVS
jgi:hypothetical protein